MSWFRWGEDRHAAQTDRLRRAERDEQRAMRRMVDAGVKVTLNADAASEALDALLGELEDRKYGKNQHSMQ